MYNGSYCDQKLQLSEIFTCYVDLDCYLNSYFKDKQIIAGFLCLIKFSYFYTFLKKNYITRRGGVF